MSNCKFKIGDKVRIVKNVWAYNANHPSIGIGDICTIISCDSYGKYPYRLDKHAGLSWCDEELELVTENKIVITTDGTKITTATLYENGKKVKTATAKCCPEDTFDFKVGAKLAYKRLIDDPVTAGVEKKKVTKYKVGDRIFAEDNMGEYPGGAWGTVVEVLDKRFHKEDYEVKFDNGYILCSHVVSVPTTPEPPKSKEETEWRVVNRPVKAGDYIRITRPTFSFDNKGDILRVSSVRKDGIAVVYAKDHPKETGHTGDFEWYYCDSEYEVVEKVTKTEEPPNPKLYNGKVVCVDNKHNPYIYTVGKIYEFVDGQMIADNGDNFPGYETTITSFKDWAKWTGSKFIPLVED